jgi:hypothetical protein
MEETQTPSVVDKPTLTQKTTPFTPDEPSTLFDLKFLIFGIAVLIIATIATLTLTEYFTTEELNAERIYWHNETQRLEDAFDRLAVIIEDLKTSGDALITENDMLRKQLQEQDKVVPEQITTNELITALESADNVSQTVKETINQTKTDLKTSKNKYCRTTIAGTFCYTIGTGGGSGGTSGAIS